MQCIFNAINELSDWLFFVLDVAKVILYIYLWNTATE